jgi:adenosylcobinamide-GDP ribazoletransferase
LRRAAAIFSLLPVPQGSHELGREDALDALRWLPLLGAGLGAGAGLVSALALRLHEYSYGIASVLGVGALAVLTRGLHLDGLADTADGLGSRAPAARALEIMRRSDIGPFGVVTLIVVLLLDVTALASLGGSAWMPLAALSVAAATGRAAAVLAALRGIPSARPDGFGALVAGGVGPSEAIVIALSTLGFGALLAAAAGASVAAWVGAQIVALGVGAGLRWHTTRRFGGVTGDVFGAVIEATTAATLTLMVLL